MKVPEPRKLPSGSWFVQLRLGGRSVPITAATQKECRRQAALVKAEYQAGKKTLPAAGSITLRGAADAYIRSVDGVLSPSTIRGYCAIAKSRFSAYHAKRLTEIDFQKMINDETAAASPKTIRNAWGFFKTAMQRAAAFAPPEVSLPQVPVKEIPFLQPEEIRPFCDALRGNIAEIPALLELHGLRRSEVLGLDWRDIDLTRGLIRVSGAAVEDVNGKLVSKDTNKNASSSRTVPIMIPQLYALLRERKEPAGRIVTISADTMLKNVKRCCREAGVTVVGNHGLRHSFASLGYHLGISERQLMELGGWSDYQTMHKIYIRIAQSDRDAARAKLAEFFAASG